MGRFAFIKEEQELMAATRRHPSSYGSSNPGTGSTEAGRIRIYSFMLGNFSPGPWFSRDYLRDHGSDEDIHWLLEERVLVRNQEDGSFVRLNDNRTSVSPAGLRLLFAADPEFPDEN